MSIFIRTLSVVIGSEEKFSFFLLFNVILRSRWKIDFPLELMFDYGNIDVKRLENLYSIMTFHACITYQFESREKSCFFSVPISPTKSISGFSRIIENSCSRNHKFSTIFSLSSPFCKLPNIQAGRELFSHNNRSDKSMGKVGYKVMNKHCHCLSVLCVCVCMPNIYYIPEWLSL